jgi:hypothetical protein
MENVFTADPHRGRDQLVLDAPCEDSHDVAGVSGAVDAGQSLIHEPLAYVLELQGREVLGGKAGVSLAKGLDCPLHVRKLACRFPVLDIVPGCVAKVLDAELGHRDGAAECRYGGRGGPGLHPFDDETFVTEPGFGCPVLAQVAVLAVDRDDRLAGCLVETIAGGLVELHLAAV